MNTINSEMRGLYKRGNTYWIAYKAASRIVRESTGTSDRRLAEAVLSKRRAEVFEGRWKGRTRESRIPLRKAIDEFIELYSKPRKISWREDRLILSRFAAFAGPNVYLQDMDRPLIERFQLKLLSSGGSKARVNRYTAALKCFFYRAVDWNKIQTNPCRGIRLYPENPRTHWLETGQMAELLTHCSHRLRPIVQVALLTGFRRGDILRLTWDRIDFEQHAVRIIQGKTQTNLVIPMSDALANVLRGIERHPDSPYVFQRRGKALSPDGWVRTDFIQARKAAGLSTTHFHDLRHTTATQLRRLGRDLQVVQQLLGHKSIRTTLRYSHVPANELREAVNRLGEKVSKADPTHFTITSQPAKSVGRDEKSESHNDANYQSELESDAELDSKNAYNCKSDDIPVGSEDDW